MANGYDKWDVATGIAVTGLSHEILDRCGFPNPTQARYLTPAFAVAFFTGLGAAMLVNQFRNRQDKDVDQQQAEAIASARLPSSRTR